MGFVEYISYEYRRRWLRAFLFILLINYVLVDFYAFKVFTQIKDGFISTTVNY